MLSISYTEKTVKYDEKSKVFHISCVLLTFPLFPKIIVNFSLTLAIYTIICYNIYIIQ